MTPPDLAPRTVVLGHSRDTPSRATITEFAERWQELGGIVLDTVDWPEEAASWLRQARRFTAGAPDAWAVAARPAGWAGMRRRLRLSTDWDPDRTFLLGDAEGPRCLRVTGGFLQQISARRPSR